jgi:hypothetical protein
MRRNEHVLAVAVVALLSLGAAQACAEDDPSIGAWKWFDGKEHHFKKNNTIHNDGKKVGEWFKGNFKHNGGRYDYKLVWTNGFTDWMNLAKKDRHLIGINNEGGKITGERK